MSHIPATMLNVPWNPARTRIAVNMGMLIDSAVPTEHKNNVAMAALYAVRLPKVYNHTPKKNQPSLHINPNVFLRKKRNKHTLATGAHINDEDPMANNTPALVTLMCSAVVPNSAAISGVAGYRQVLENVAASVMKLTVKRMTHLCQLGRSVPVLKVSFIAGGDAVDCPMVL